MARPLAATPPPEADQLLRLFSSATMPDLRPGGLLLGEAPFQKSALSQLNAQMGELAAKAQKDPATLARLNHPLLTRFWYLTQKDLTPQERNFVWRLSENDYPSPTEACRALAQLELDDLNRYDGQGLPLMLQEAREATLVQGLFYFLGARGVSDWSIARAVQESALEVASPSRRPGDRDPFSFLTEAERIELFWLHPDTLAAMTGELEKTLRTSTDSSEKIKAARKLSYITFVLASRRIQTPEPFDSVLLGPSAKPPLAKPEDAKAPEAPPPAPVKNAAPEAPAVPGEDPKLAAQKLFEEGTRLLTAKNYDGAVLKFRAAFKKDPNPDYLIKIAQVLETKAAGISDPKEKLKAIEPAAATYKEFQRVAPADHKDRRAVQKALAALAKVREETGATITASEREAARLAAEAERARVEAEEQARVEAAKAEAEAARAMALQPLFDRIQKIFANETVFKEWLAWAKANPKTDVKKLERYAAALEEMKKFLGDKDFATLITRPYDNNEDNIFIKTTKALIPGGPDGWGDSDSHHGLVMVTNLSASQMKRAVWDNANKYGMGSGKVNAPVTVCSEIVNPAGKTSDARNGPVYLMLVLDIPIIRDKMTINKTELEGWGGLGWYIPWKLHKDAEMPWSCSPDEHEGRKGTTFSYNSGHWRLLPLTADKVIIWYAGETDVDGFPWKQPTAGQQQDGIRANVLQFTTFARRLR